jgi:regulator of protease activity HflC (stomatin/prohibitin superfamily)
MAALIVAAVLLLFVVLVIVRAVRIVPQAQTGIVERLGRYNRTLEPGLHFMIPFFDKLRRPLVDMREQVVTFQPQPVITQDNVTISIDTVFYFTITDPFRSTYEVANLLVAVEQLTITTLRNVIGSLSLEEALTSRDKINSDLRIVLDEATERWGIRVNRIELKSIDPPATIQEAMEKQMRAERDKRAAILQAEGAKQSAILRAEGEREANILSAEGEKQGKVLRAQGEAEATRTTFQAIHDGNPTPELLAYEYLKALPKLADGQGMTLMMVPSDAMPAMGAVSALGAGLQAGQDVARSVPGARESKELGSGTNERAPERDR